MVCHIEREVSIEGVLRTRCDLGQKLSRGRGKLHNSYTLWDLRETGMAWTCSRAERCDNCAEHFCVEMCREETALKAQATGADCKGLWGCIGFNGQVTFL